MLKRRSSADLAIHRAIIESEKLLAAPDLYFRGDYFVLGTSLIVKSFGWVSTDTYFNSLGTRRWLEETPLRDLDFNLSVESGRGHLTLWLRTVDTISLITGPIEFDGSDVSVRIRIPDRPGILFWRVNALTEVTIRGAAFGAIEPAPRNVKFAIVITAFRRDEVVRSAIERFTASSLPKDGHRLFVIDNGHTLEPSSSQWGTIIRNVNLGGGWRIYERSDRSKGGWTVHTLPVYGR